MFKWLVSRIGRLIGRKMNALFYQLLYRELLKEVNEIDGNDPAAAFLDFKEMGILGALDSAHRQASVLKYFPGDPLKLLEYMEILWQVIFGLKMGEHNVVHEEIPGREFPVVKYQITKCPVCGGYGDSEEDTVDISAAGDSPQLYACGIMGMLQTVANFIMETRGSEWRIVFSETKCIARGDPFLEISCEIVPAAEVAEPTGEPIARSNPLFSIEKFEEFLSAPLDKVKETLEEIVETNLSMTPEELLSYFENYEDDMVRIIGYLGVHLMNEYGGAVEKVLENDALAKAAGYWFQSLRDFVRLFLPREVVEDYHKLFVDLLDGLAPDSMVDRLRDFESFDFVTLLLEGAQQALENLGIDFDELKANVWEELKGEAPGTGPSPSLVLSLVQELMALTLKLAGLPVKMVLTSQHAQLKTVASSAKDLYEDIREHGDRIVDIIGELTQG
ncbi:MAG: hypothetical protein ACTSU5_13065 [Promethearchaeota archaeon]